mmetsp:Transcript_22490/g.21641  ORF Transcript_22490/g.21641 Transcript_22490/m.21641 type:complete len:153 (-) Transcript_22490:48-506(-)
MYLGYFSSLHDTPEIVVNRPYPPSYKNIPLTFIKVFLVAVFIIAQSLKYIAFRMIINHGIFGHEHQSLKIDAMISGVLIVVPGYLSVIYPSVTDVLSIHGSVVVATFGFVIPAVMLLSKSDKWYQGYNLFYLAFYGFLIAISLLNLASSAMT